MSRTTSKRPLFSSVFVLALLLFLLPGAVVAQDDDAVDADPPGVEDAEPESEIATEIEDVIIVTAGRTEQSMHQVPSAFSVITAKEIENAAADDYGDLLRSVPGLNVAQFSARDIQISSRQATSSLANDQLVLLDGRTLYLDFFGFVMWDFLPVNPREIEQIEVVRGPGSAVWGANALSGVINLITKSPREIAGTSVIAGGGELGTLYGSLTHAAASERLGYKLSLGYFEQDAYDRPTGTIPGTSTPYPPFPNEGTEQPKVDLRVDFDPTPEQTWSFSGGWAATDGIMHSGIGPFAIDSGSNLAYVKAGWSKGAMNATFFINDLDGDASNLLTVGTDGQPIELGFETRTYNFDFTHSLLLGEHNFITWGLNARQNEFDLSIAPGADEREEYGVFVQDELLLGDKVRWLLGGRYDDADPVGSKFSPRTSLLFSPSYDHTFRVSYNEAYRAPSAINNFLDIDIVNQVFIDPRLIAAGLAPGVPCQFVLNTCTPFFYVFPSAVDGDPDLEAVELESFEAGYVGTFAGGRTTVSVAAYQSELTGDLDFFTAANYSATNPPPGWPVFANVPGIPFPVPAVPPNTFPSQFSYRNIGKIDNQGVELSVHLRPTNIVSLQAAYSWQDDPDVEGVPREEVNTPPEHRANLTMQVDPGRWFASAAVSYVDDAVWTDVLDARFHGPTESFTQVNLSLGVRLMAERLALVLNAANVFDEEIQQHVFGDIITRKITAEIRYEF